MLILSGAFVGFAIGLTGVGGGSLMTPILLLFGYPAAVAIGTDLLYAAITKASGMYFHQRHGHVAWKTVGLLAAGSIPVSILINVFIIDNSIVNNDSYSAFLTTFLGVMLIVTATVMIFSNKIQHRLMEDKIKELPKYQKLRSYRPMCLLGLGITLGVCVTFSSVGAGAFGAAILFLLWPSWPAKHIVGTDIAHAVPLTLVAALIVGSLPGIYVGTHVGSIMPERFLRSVLIIVLMSLGLYFSITQGH